MKYLIIGAGPCGLAMAKALCDAGILYEQVEADSDIGGNWRHGVYSSVYTDACKDVMQFPEFPFPENFPDFLSQKHMLSYLNAYVDFFALRDKIQFSKTVVWLNAVEGNKWNAVFADGSQAMYKGVLVCNGHHWDKSFPDLNGAFDGIFIHSKDYKNPTELRDKRVLVIGSGNSAVDIACEAARVGLSSVISMRQSPWIFPKTFMGIPLGRIKARNYPTFIQRVLIKVLLRLTFGKHAYYRMPVPMYEPLEKHPTVSEEFPYYLKHGRIEVKPQIMEIKGKLVKFEDESSAEFDLIVAATGYKLSFPFLPDQLARTNGQNLECIGYCAYPDYMGLFFVGWPQIRGGIGSLASALAIVIVNLIKLEEETRLPSGAILQSKGNKLSGTNLYGSAEFFRWTSKHSYAALLRASRKLSGLDPHKNVITPEYEPQTGEPFSVF